MNRKTDHGWDIEAPADERVGNRYAPPKPPRHLITKSIDDSGNILEYGYDANQKLETIKIEAKNGWTGFAKKGSQGTLWTFKNPRGNILQYKYGNSGYLAEIEADGKKVAKYGYDLNGRVLNIHYQGYEEKLYYADNGYIKEYEVQKVSKDAKSLPGVEKVSFAYNDSGGITEIEGSSVGHVIIEYSENNMPIILRGGQWHIKYAYNSDRMLKQLYLSDGLCASYEYDEGKRLSKIELKKGDRRAEYIFAGGRIANACNFLGGRTEYGYNDKGFLNSVIDSEGNKGKYLYDDKDRLREIHFPDGRWIEYNYRDKKGSKDSTQGQSITVISHLLSSPIGKIANKNENPVSVKVVVARSHVAWADVLSWFNGIGIFHVEK